MDKLGLDNLSPAKILALGFFGLIMVGALLLAMPFSSTAEPLSPIDALFTATSAVCVTGLVVVETGARLSLAGQVIVLVLIQIGGLGIMTMATLVAILLGKRITFKERLVIQEAYNHYSIEGIVRLVRYVIMVTFAVEFSAAVLLFVRFRSILPFPKAIWFSMFHSVSAFCNAGFDLFGSSLEAFVADPLINVVFISLIVLGGLGFTVVANIYSVKSFRHLSPHTVLVLRMTILLIIIPALVIAALEWNGALSEYTISGKLLGSVFASVTTRTAGFNTVPTGAWGNAVLSLMMVLMFIGASPASTGGGVKTTTFAMLILYVSSIMRGSSDVNFASRRIPQSVINKCVAVSFVAVLVVFTTTFLMSALEDQPFSAVLFESVSAFGTVGLSRGITPMLSSASKAVLILTMFTGRVGVLTFMFALSTRSRKTPTFRYPEGQILVG